MAIETIVAIVAPILTAVITFLLTRRRYKADAIGSEIENVAEVAKLWRELAADMQKRYTELTKEVSKLRAENESLSKQLKELRRLVAELKGENAKLLETGGCKLPDGVPSIALIVAMVGLGLVGCSPKVGIPVALHDSVRIETVERIVEVPQPIDSSLVQAYLKCDSLGNIYISQIAQLQGERVKQELKLSNGLITVKATDSNKTFSHEKTAARIEYKEKAVPVPYEVNKLTTWQAFQIWIGRLVLIALALWSIYRLVIKKYLTPIQTLFKKFLQ